MILSGRSIWSLGFAKTQIKFVFFSKLLSILFGSLALAAKDGVIAKKDALLEEKDKEIKALAYHIGHVKMEATWMKATFVVWLG